MQAVFQAVWFDELKAQNTSQMWAHVLLVMHLGLVEINLLLRLSIRLDFLWRDLRYKTVSRKRNYRRDTYLLIKQQKHLLTA